MDIHTASQQIITPIRFPFYPLTKEFSFALAMAVSLSTAPFRASNMAAGTVSFFTSPRSSELLFKSTDPKESFKLEGLRGFDIEDIRRVLVGEGEAMVFFRLLAAVEGWDLVIFRGDPTLGYSKKMVL
jgi:hypothetical protein